MKQMVKAILTIADTTCLIEPLLAGVGDRRLFFSFGEEIPDLSSMKTSIWMGGAYATQLQNIGLAQTLCSPGAHWLPSLDSTLTSRTIHSGELTDLESYGTKQLWVKPSEAKIKSLPAASYSYPDLVNIFKENKLPSTVSLQWTEEILDIDFEHRFFVADNKVISGSPYKVNGKGYSKTINMSQYDNAEMFAQFVLDSDSTNMPPAFVIDVGLNMKTQKWFVIEANRAWSSGLYGTNPSAALDVIDYACEYSQDKWQWNPDSHLINLNREWEELIVIPVDSSTSGFFEFIKHSV
jgi:hypothetical protein